MKHCIEQKEKDEDEEEKEDDDEEDEDPPSPRRRRRPRRLQSSQVQLTRLFLEPGCAPRQAVGLSSHTCAAATWEAERSEAGGVFIYSPLWFFLCCDPNSNSDSSVSGGWMEGSTGGGGASWTDHQPQHFFSSFLGFLFHLFLLFIQVDPGVTRVQTYDPSPWCERFYTTTSTQCASGQRPTRRTSGGRWDAGSLLLSWTSATPSVCTRRGPTTACGPFVAPLAF